MLLILQKQKTFSSVQTQNYKVPLTHCPPPPHFAVWAMAITIRDGHDGCHSGAPPRALYVSPAPRYMSTVAG